MWGEVGPTAHLICLVLDMPGPSRGGRYSYFNASYSTVVIGYLLDVPAGYGGFGLPP
jgi:hypothetical protein